MKLLCRPILCSKVNAKIMATRSKSIRLEIGRDAVFVIDPPIISPIEIRIQRKTWLGDPLLGSETVGRLRLLDCIVAG